MKAATAKTEINETLFEAGNYKIDYAYKEFMGRVSIDRASPAPMTSHTFILYKDGQFVCKTIIGAAVLEYEDKQSALSILKKKIV